MLNNRVNRKSQLPIKTKKVKKIYKNKWLDFEEHQVIASDGKSGVYGVLDYGDGVSILGIDDRRKVILIKEYKYAVKKFMFQLPAGTIEKGENPLIAAKREFLEETGLKAEKWKYLGTTNPFPTNITTTVHLYAATNLMQVGKAENDVDLYKLPLSKVKDMIMKNKITHSGSVVCILKYIQVEKI